MYIIKIGGGADINTDGIIADLASSATPSVIVHGANALRDELAEKLELNKTILTSVSGYSSVFSDREAIDVILMSYAGLRNKRIVEQCQQHGINAIGLSGIDGQMIRGRRNKGIRVRENGKTLIKRDFSGKPVAINEPLLKLLLDNGYSPVLSIPILDEKNTAINSENDDIVTQLAGSIDAERIFQFIAAPGFLQNPKDPQSLVKSLSADDLAVRENQVEGRMKRKILALRKLYERGGARVHIADGRVEHPLRDALAGKGTLIEQQE